MIQKKEEKVVEFFRALSDKTRLRVLASLAKESKTVGEIHKDLKRKVTLSAISHQLKILSNNEMIDYEKDGREKTFSLSNNFCFCLLKDVMNHFGQKFPKKCDKKEKYKK